MKTLLNQNRGQFVIIASLMIALMIVTIGFLMHKTVTYYKHEPWEEYLTILDNVKLSSQKVVEISLANYTQTQNETILLLNLQQWSKDIQKIFPGYGVSLNYSVANTTYNVSGTTIDYSSGLNTTWHQSTSYSIANATFTLNITAIGLIGYKYSITTLLNLTILDVNLGDNEITVIVKKENEMPVDNLDASNFQVLNSNGTSINIASVSSSYDETYALVYIIKCEQTLTTPLTVNVWDSRGIKVTATYP